MQPVEVRYRDRSGVLVAQGGRVDGIVGFRWGFTAEGRDHEQLSFVLVDEGFLLAQPVLFTGSRRGWWYCDLVTVENTGDVVVIEDLYLDVVVGQPGQPYRVLDLDEPATAVADGVVDPAVAIEGLRQFQRFLDRRLHDEPGVSGWPAFPPEGVDRSDWADLPVDWAWRT